MAVRHFDAALTAEIQRIRGLRNLESRARATKRAIVLSRSAEQAFIMVRDDLVREMRNEFGWTYEKIAAYFGLSRQRCFQIAHERSGFDLEGCDTLPADNVAAASSETPKVSLPERGSGSPLGGTATEQGKSRAREATTEGSAE